MSDNSMLKALWTSGRFRVTRAKSPSIVNNNGLDFMDPSFLKMEKVFTNPVVSEENHIFQTLFFDDFHLDPAALAAVLVDRRDTS